MRAPTASSKVCPEDRSVDEGGDARCGRPGACNDLKRFASKGIDKRRVSGSARRRKGPGRVRSWETRCAMRRDTSATGEPSIRVTPPNGVGINLGCIDLNPHRCYARRDRLTNTNLRIGQETRCTRRYPGNASSKWRCPNPARCFRIPAGRWAPKIGTFGRCRARLHVYRPDKQPRAPFSKVAAAQTQTVAREGRAARAPTWRQPLAGRRKASGVLVDLKTETDTGPHSRVAYSGAGNPTDARGFRRKRGMLEEAGYKIAKQGRGRK